MISKSIPLYSLCFLYLIKSDKVNLNFNVSESIPKIFNTHFRYNPSNTSSKKSIEFKKSLFKERENEAKDFIFKDEKDLKTELEKLFEFALKERNESFIWDKIYSSNHDEIFPQNALKNTFSKLIFLDEPHFAFFHFKTWDEI